MKGLFIILEALYDTSGISKKIAAQVSSFKNNGAEMDLAYFKVNENNIYTGRFINGQCIDKFPTDGILSRVNWRIKFNNLFNFIVQNKVEFVYIRYMHFANPFFIAFLKRLKLAGIRIIIEIPTYPYDQEYVKSSINIKIEKICRKWFKRYVDRVVTFTDDSTIFDVATIRISNGIDINAIKKVNGRKYPRDVINMIGVAALSFWHGYDRVILGLKDYYANGEVKEKAIFHIIADINLPETINCRKLVEQHNLQDYVIFHGKKFDKELDALFDISDVGVGSLGRHRSGITDIKPIKNREYCARGIPFFYSETDADFEQMPFILKVPANNLNIDINSVIQFVNNNTSTTEEIRNYANKYLTWDTQVGKIIDDINAI